MLPFCTNAQFLIRYDGRWIGKNILDDGTAASIASLTDPNTTAGGILEALIIEASELLMAACAVGKRYTEDTIRPRPLDSPPYVGGGTLLVRIVSDLTIGLVLKRRGRALTDEDALSKPYGEALGYLEELRRGERIFFAIPLVPEAGLPGTGNMNPRPGIDPPLVTQEAARYFGFPVGYNPGYGRWYGPGPWC